MIIAGGYSNCAFDISGTIFQARKASGGDMVVDLLDGFAAHGWRTDVFTPTPTRNVTEEERRIYSTDKKLSS